MIRNVFQIAISDGSKAATGFTQMFDRNVHALKNLYPAANYMMFDRDSLREFIENNFDGEVIRCYDKITPYAFKADLGRYCLLYKLGGLYSDLSYLHLSELKFDSTTSMAVFRDIPGHPSWAVSNAIIYSDPAHEALEQAIQMILVNCRNDFYGCSPLEPTGPLLFGKALTYVQSWPSICFGDSKIVSYSPEHGPNIVKFDQSGNPIAYRAKRMNSDVSELIGSGGNSYNDLWNSRRIWGERVSRFCGDSKVLILGSGATREGGRIELATGHDGVRLYGPYCSLVVGSYLVSLSLEMSSAAGHITIRLTADQGRRHIADTGAMALHPGAHKLDIPINLDNHADNFEACVMSDSAFAGSIKSLEIHHYA